MASPVTTPVYRRILALFEAEGVTTLFGIPDPNFVHLFLEAEARGWIVVSPHHEAAGGFMAEAATRITGRPALAVGTQGPGLANLMPAILCAMAEHSPVIFLAGQRARPNERRVVRGRFQFSRQEALVAPSVKYAGVIEYAAQTDDVLREAIRRSLSGTPGPSYLEIPQPVMLEHLPEAPVPPPASYRLVAQGADGARLAEAARLIGAARRPILLVGHGVYTSRTGGAVRDLAELMGCPVIQTPGGASFIPGLESRSFPYGFSDVANAAVAGSDLCVALGTELGEPVHFGRNRHWAEGNATRRWILVEQDATAIGVNRPVDVPLVGDLRAVVPQLASALRDAPRAPHPDLAALVTAEAERRAARAAQARSKPDGTGERPIHPARFVVEATEAMPEDAIFIRDGGATVITQFTFGQARPRDVLWNQNYGHIGTGLPYAIGAMLADRAATGESRPAMLLTSDSSFLFHIAELEVALRENLPLVCVVGVDNQWGLEVAVYKSTFGPGSAETGAHWSSAVRFDVVAQGLGCHGEYVTLADDIKPAIARSLASGRPAVVHVVIDPKANSEEIPNYAEFASWFG